MQLGNPKRNRIRIENKTKTKQNKTNKTEKGQVVRSVADAQRTQTNAAKTLSTNERKTEGKTTHQNVQTCLSVLCGRCGSEGRQVRTMQQGKR